MDSQVNHQELFILTEGNKQKEVYSTKRGCEKKSVNLIPSMIEYK